MTVSSKVVWNPYYAISKGNGAFEIDQIPPGTCKVTVWHPYVGIKAVEATISKGEKTNLDIFLP